MVVGSPVPSDLFDLQWFPTLLTTEEIGDVMKYRASVFNTVFTGAEA